MRWLFLFVLSLNLAYFAWALNKTSSDDYTNVPTLKNVEPIVLLSELKREVAAIDIVKVAPVEKISADRVPEAGSGEDKVSPASDADIKKAETDVQSDVAPNSAEIVDASQLAKKSAKSASGSKENNDAIKVPAEPSPVTSCYTLGPFRDLDELRGLTREIKSYVVTADFRGHEEKEQSLYWVYVNPEKNRKKAIEAGHRLQEKKIKDFYVIRKGEKINGISVGRFRNKEAAYELAAKVQKSGFDVTVEPIFKSYTVYWLDYQLTDGVTIPEATFDKYIKTDEKGKISRLSRNCED